MKYVFPVTVAVLLAAFFAQSAVAQPILTALTNADVTRLVAMRVSEQTVIAVIHEAESTQFDLSPRAVSELTVLGVSTVVIAAMRQSLTRSAKGLALPAPSPAAAQTLAGAAAKAEDKRRATTEKTTKVFTNADLPHEPPPAPELTAAEFADIDRSKFDKVYAASVAMVASGYAATLTDERMREKAFTWLVNHLHEKGTLSDDDIDTMLLVAVGPRPY